MLNLTTRTKELILKGAQETGSFEEGYYTVEHQLYVDEAQETFDFCCFIDRELGGAGPSNIDWIFEYYKDQDDPTLKARANNLKDRIKSHRAFLPTPPPPTPREQMIQLFLTHRKQMNEDDMVALNRIIVEEIKQRRKHNVRNTRGILEIGQSVTVNSQTARGKIFTVEAIKRTNAICRDENGSRYNVPISLIEVEY